MSDGKIEISVAEVIDLIVTRSNEQTENLQKLVDCVEDLNNRLEILESFLGPPS